MSATDGASNAKVFLSPEWLHAQALVSPLSGLLGDNLNRIHLVAAGTLLWGGMAAAIGMATSLPQACCCD